MYVWIWSTRMSLYLWGYVLCLAIPLYERAAELLFSSAESERSFSLSSAVFPLFRLSLFPFFPSPSPFFHSLLFLFLFSFSCLFFSWSRQQANLWQHQEPLPEELQIWSRPKDYYKYNKQTSFLFPLSLFVFFFLLCHFSCLSLFLGILHLV